MKNKLDRVNLVGDLIRLGVRYNLLIELIPSSTKICSILGGVISTEECLFPIESRKSYNTCGWIKFKMGSLIANELFRIYSSMYSYKNIIGKPISPEQLVQVTLAFNLKYGKVYSVDVNQVYSLFVGINKRLVYPSKCQCGIQYLRLDHPNNFECPQCRLDYKKSINTKNNKTNEIYNQLHNYAKQKTPG